MARLQQGTQPVRIQGLADPVDSGDASNRGFVTTSITTAIGTTVTSSSSNTVNVGQATDTAVVDADGNLVINTTADPNVQSDWDATTGDDFIVNKPVPQTSGLGDDVYEIEITNGVAAWVAAAGTNVTPNWDAAAGTAAEILNKPTLDEIDNPVLDIDLNSNKIVNLTDPTADQDAATMNYVDTEISDAETEQLRDTYIVDEGEVLGSSFDIDNDLLVTKEYVDSLNVVNELEDDVAYPEGSIVVDPNDTADLYRALSDLDLDFDISAGTGIFVPIGIRGTWSATLAHSFPLIQREIEFGGITLISTNYGGDIFVGTAEGHTGIITNAGNVSVDGSSNATAADSSNLQSDCNITVTQGAIDTLRIGRVAVNITVHTIPDGGFDISLGSGVTGPGFGEGNAVTFSEAGQTSTVFYEVESSANTWVSHLTQQIL